MERNDRLISRRGLKREVNPMPVIFVGVGKGGKTAYFKQLDDSLACSSRDPFCKKIIYVDYDPEDKTISAKELAEKILNTAEANVQDLPKGVPVWIFLDKNECQAVQFNRLPDLLEFRDRKYHVVWSNPSIEAWYYTHFCDPDPNLDPEKGLTRTELSNMLDEMLKKNGVEDGYKEIKLCQVLNVYGSIEKAIGHSKAAANKSKSSDYTSCWGTSAYELAEYLLAAHKVDMAKLIDMFKEHPPAGNML